MVNVAQQTWLQSLGISLYVPNTWVTLNDQRSKEQQDNSFESVRSSLKTTVPAVEAIQSPQKIDAENKPQTVVVNMLCYVTDQLCFIEHEHPKAGLHQRQLMDNILLALGEQSTAISLPLKVNRDDYRKAQQQIGAFLQARNILNTSTGTLSKTVVVMGNTMYRLLISNEGFSQAIGLNNSLTSAMKAWNIEPTTELNALVIPNTLAMIKDVQNKKIAWSILKNFANHKRLID